MDDIKERISRMSREEKIEEFRMYLVISGMLKLDIDAVMADQVAVGAPDSALDDALLKCAQLAGRISGRAMVTAPEFIESLKDQRQSLHRWVTQSNGLSRSSIRTGAAPPFSVRRNRNRDA